MVVLSEKDSSTLSRDSWVTQPLVVPGLLSGGLAYIYLFGNFASWMVFVSCSSTQHSYLSVRSNGVSSGFSDSVQFNALHS